MLLGAVPRKIGVRGTFTNPDSPKPASLHQRTLVSLAITIKLYRITNAAGRGHFQGQPELHGCSARMRGFEFLEVMRPIRRIFRNDANKNSTTAIVLKLRVILLYVARQHVKAISLLDPFGRNADAMQALIA